MALVGEQLSDYCIDRGYNLEFQLIRREGATVVGGTTFLADCALSQSEATDCPNLR